jgi:hypothetical protein
MQKDHVFTMQSHLFFLIALKYVALSDTDEVEGTQPLHEWSATAWQLSREQGSLGLHLSS